jgi:hypothetical protein
MTRNELHQLVDDLTDDQVDPAAELLDAYSKGDRALIRLLTAPLVPAEPDELAALTELTDEDLVDTTSAEDLPSRLGVA